MVIQKIYAEMCDSQPYFNYIKVKMDDPKKITWVTKK